MTPLFINPDWFEEYWYAKPPAGTSRPPAIVGWLAATFSVALAALAVAAS